jgi:hypothetical protein
MLDRRGIELAGIRVAGVPIVSERGVYSRPREVPAATGQIWPADPLVVVSHYPLLSQAAFLSSRGHPYPGDLIGAAELAAPLVARDRPAVAISGHIHARISAAEGALLQLTLGALVESPYECAVIDLRLETDGSAELSRTSHRLARGAAAHDPVFAPDEERWRFDGGTWRPA